MIFKPLGASNYGSSGGPFGHRQMGIMARMPLDYHYSFYSSIDKVNTDDDSSYKLETTWRLKIMDGDNRVYEFHSFKTFLYKKPVVQIPISELEEVAKISFNCLQSDFKKLRVEVPVFNEIPPITTELLQVAIDKLKELFL